MLVSSMAVCNDDGKRFSAWAEGRGKSGFVPQINVLHLIRRQKTVNGFFDREKYFWRHNRSFWPEDYGEVSFFVRRVGFLNGPKKYGGLMVIICKFQFGICNVGIVGVWLDFFFFFQVSEKCNFRVLDSGSVKHFGSIGLMNEIDLLKKKNK